MPTVLLVRHGRTTANASGVLAGWTPGVALDEAGRAQVEALGARMACLELARVVSSPLQRCLETAQGLLDARTTDAARGAATRRPSGTPPLLTDDALGECRYGDWTGRALKDLAKDPLWRVVQAHPSAATFPGPEGESMAAMQHRAVAAVRAHDGAVAADHGDHAIWVAVTHGDIVKAVLADALGMHLDSFQRIQVDPASVSVVRYTPLRPFVVRMNETGGELAALAAAPPRRRSTGGRSRVRAGSRRSPDPSSSDATIGGETGTDGTQ
ncbi:MAG: MSMEG_4193 family putative phosphomutase [Kineosporiaceae bacterium]|nr:MSMEG_4193 family putative phosphomutase [Kineosporiaceae bacterium]